METARFVTREGDRRPGVSRRVLVAKPALGAELAVPVPGGVYWRALTFRAVLTTSATVANRTPRLTLSDGNNVYFTVEAPAVQAAGAVVTYQASAGFSGSYTGASGAVVTVGLPLLSLESGSVIGSLTGALDPGDQWSGITLFVEEYYETALELSERADERQAAELEYLAALGAGSPVASRTGPLGG